MSPEPPAGNPFRMLTGNRDLPGNPELSPLQMNPISSSAMIFRGAGEALEPAELPVPPPGPGEILVRNEFTTLCKSDINTYCGRRQEKTPTILGHEIVGRIAALGPDAPELDIRGQAIQVGDRISWAIFASDPTDVMSRRGIPQKGKGLFKYGHEQLRADQSLHGGLRQYILLRAHTPVARIGSEVPLPVAALVNCSVATVAGALRLAGSVLGRHVLVSGAGMLGMVACAMCRTSGAASITAVDTSPERLARAATFGATATETAGRLRPDDDSKNFDLVLEFSGAPDAMAASLERLSIGGAAVWVGATFPTDPVRIDPERLVRRLLTIRGLHNYNREDFAQAVAFVEQHHRQFPFSGLVEASFPLEQAQAAFEHALHAKPFRVGVETT
ncbi:MAG: hypothetical protein RLY31_3164 [Bacteroidota bacterium]